MATQDRSFLLDRLLLYERADTSSESEDTDSSDDDLRDTKRKRFEPTKVIATSAKKKKMAPKLIKPPQVQDSIINAADGHMTPEEVERHLQSRQTFMELLPERAPPTVPNEMFSNDPSLDR